MAVSWTGSRWYATTDAATPVISLVYALPAAPAAALAGTASGCGASAADLGSGNSGCCTEATPCGVDEGECSSDARCAGDLTCVSYSCSRGPGEENGSDGRQRRRNGSKWDDISMK